MRRRDTLAAVALLLASGCASAPCGGAPRVYRHGLLLPGACARKPDVRALCEGFDGLATGSRTTVAPSGDLLVYTRPSLGCD